MNAIITFCGWIILVLIWHTSLKRRDIEIYSTSYLQKWLAYSSKTRRLALKVSFFVKIKLWV